MTEESRRDSEILKGYSYRLYKEKNRERKNWRIYDATDYGQWDGKAVQQAVQEGRPLSTYNISKKLIDITYGSIQADPFEVDFDTELGEDVQDAMVLDMLLTEDKEIGQFYNSFDPFVRAGFIYRGYLQWYIDRDKDRRGRVNWRTWHGDMITVDPDRRTTDINANENIFTHLWMSPQRIKDKWPHKAKDINTLIELWEKYQNATEDTEETEDTGAIYDITLNDRSTSYYDKKTNLFKVITRYWLKKVKYWDVYDASTGSVLCTKPREEAELMAQAYKLEGKPIQLLDHSIMECQTRTTCPGINLDLILDQGPYELQLGGYPWAEFSCDQINGRPHTYMDDLSDPQVDFNKRHNTATHILMTKANNVLLVEEDAMDDPNDLDHMCRTRNKPGSYFKLASGAIGENKIKYLDPGQPPNDAFTAANQIKEVIQDLTPAVPSMQAVGQSQESGVLFNSKLQQAMIAVQIPTKALRRFWQRFGDMYIMAAKQVYTYPMRVESKRDGKIFELNVPGGMNIKSLSRLKVTVSQSPTSETYRRRLLQSYLSIAQYMQDPYLAAELNRIMISSLPDIPEEEADQLREAAKLSAEFQKATMESQMAQMGGGQPQPQANPEELMKKVMGGVPGTQQLTQ